MIIFGWVVLGLSVAGLIFMLVIAYYDDRRMRREIVARIRARGPLTSWSEAETPSQSPARSAPPDAPGGDP